MSLWLPHSVIRQDEAFLRKTFLALRTQTSPFANLYLNFNLSISIVLSGITPSP